MRGINAARELERATTPTVRRWYRDVPHSATVYVETLGVSHRAAERLIDHETGTWLQNEWH